MTVSEAESIYEKELDELLYFLQLEYFSKAVPMEFISTDDKVNTVISLAILVDQRRECRGLTPYAIISHESIHSFRETRAQEADDDCY
jgi:hypothetical protein